MKLFGSTNIDTINDCRWYFDFQIFQIPIEVLEKKGPGSKGKLRTAKTYTVIPYFWWRNLVTLKVAYTSFSLLLIDMLCFRLWLYFV